MNNKLTTPIAILIGSFIVAGTILYTSGNLSNPIIQTAHASGLSISDFEMFHSGFDKIANALDGISACRN